MIYLDTNVLVYALCKNVDDVQQKEISQNILKTTVKNGNLLLSEISLYEYAFVSKKLGENEAVICENLKFLQTYCKPVNNIEKDVIQLMFDTSTYKQSFDAYHMCFCKYYNCDKLVTFDVGFKKFNNYFNIEIEIL